MTVALLLSGPIPAVRAQQEIDFTTPKTETQGISVTKPGLSVLPTSVRMDDLRFDNVFSVDPADGRFGRITYTLPEPAFVKIRALRQGTRELFLSSIVDFEYREAGSHEEVWDGRDYWGVLIDHTQTPFTIQIQTESLTAPEIDSYSGRTLGAVDPVGDMAPVLARPTPIDYAPGERQSEVVERTNYPGRHVHGLHPKEVEHVPLLEIVSPTANQVLRGNALIQVAVDEKRRGFGDRYGYGVRYYVDDQIVHEEFYRPASRGQFSYQLDTTAFDDGSHILYVGMCDHNDHVTSQGFQIVIANAAQTDRVEGATNERKEVPKH